jgi:hypothetical protein
MPILYHRTDSAGKILAEGFRDCARGLGEIFGPRVWLSASPLDCNEGAKGNQLLEVVVDLSTEELFYCYEVKEADKPHREFVFPASFLNAKAKVRMLIGEDLANAERGPWWNEYPAGEPQKTWDQLRCEDIEMADDPGLGLPE